MPRSWSGCHPSAAAVAAAECVPVLVPGRGRPRVGRGMDRAEPGGMDRIPVNPRVLQACTRQMRWNPPGAANSPMPWMRVTLRPGCSMRIGQASQPHIACALMAWSRSGRCPCIRCQSAHGSHNRHRRQTDAEKACRACAAGLDTPAGNTPDSTSRPRSRLLIAGASASAPAPRTRCKAGPPAGCSLQFEPVSLTSVFQLWSGGDGAPDKEKAHREMRLFHSPPGSHSG